MILKRIRNVLFIGFISLYIPTANAQIVLPDSLLSYHNKLNALFSNICNAKNTDRKDLEEVEILFNSRRPQAYDIKTFIRVLSNTAQTDSLIKKWAKIGISEYGMRTNDLFEESQVDYYDSVLNYKELNLCFLSNHFDNRRDIFAVEHYFFNDTYFRTKLARYKLSNDSALGYDGLLIAVQYDTLEIRPFINYMIDKYDFPSPQDIGFYGTELFNFILRHHSIPDSVLISALYRGKIHPIDFASLISYSYFKRKISNMDYSPQLVNTNGVYYLKNMGDYAAIDKRRSLVGLPSLYIYSKLAKPNFHLNQDYLTYWFQR